MRATQSQVVEKIPWISGDSKVSLASGLDHPRIIPPGVRRNMVDLMQLAKVEREVRAKAPASVTIVAKKATSNGNAQSYTAKVVKETPREAARAWEKQRVVARVKEADSKESVTSVGNLDTQPENAGKEAAREADTAKQEERAE